LPVEITYSFWNEGTENFDDPYQPNNPKEKFNPTKIFDWSQSERDSLVNALKTWEAVANIKFSNAGDNQQTATFGFYNIDDTAVIDDKPIGDLGVMGLMSPPRTQAAGIGYFNRQGAGWNVNNGNFQGGNAFITLIHEIGHGLGLAHPHDDGGGSLIYPGITAGTIPDYEADWDTGDYGLNQGLFTTMTYNDGYNYSKERQYKVKGKGYQGTPMAFDIAAIQYLYGANHNYNAGNIALPSLL
jgi:serralysin